MTTIAPVSPTELNQRRRTLRHQRRIRFFQSGWRQIAILGLAAGAVWTATLPAWVIRQPEQVTVEGNRLISDQTVRSLLPIVYPQSLLKIQPQAIAQSLESKAPIAQATVDRQLFPPSLTVRIQERVPVAVSTAKTPQSATQPALLDDSGLSIPLQSYTALNQNFKQPTLKVSGELESYRPYWSAFYQAIARNPVKVLEVIWDDPTNLILKTELGVVHFGSYGDNFPNQLTRLDQMRRLNTRISPTQISHIDLSNPDSPKVHMNASKTPVKLGTP
ncbi:cell division protein FtsQ/DivIB [Myxacorys almedinensis]|uniref:FtsQ-type POTRA domain-containing protein n=1 Tax=Myxacorys almedinensis A TaxID=2690445 RepID=A0A8J8CII0_9CYAN|nr:FtsQ-type POTRA domain-containing protein [Myxacorys almedinensis]NDJ16536.1 FtsQ-type POTRA domain-containing protein [Myxacorys almedinensis A]